MKKIFITKGEDVSAVVEKIINDPEDELVLMVPKGAMLVSSSGNFLLIKREADAARKKITVESVDEDILEMARASKLDASHPLFGGEKSSSLSDIVPAGGAPQTEKADKAKTEAAAAKKRVKKTTKQEEPSTPVKIPITVIPHEEEEEPEPEEVAPTLRIESQSPKVSPMQFGREEPPELSEPAWYRRYWKLLVAGVALVVLIFTGVAVVDAMWSKATITINFKKSPWTYDHAFVANTAVSKVDADKNILPAEVFTANKNMSQPYPATATKNVSQKATGNITIYNAYNSSPQTLVATTRFETPDGKIFRIISSVVVPGAKITNGKIVPSSIDAPVAADQPGPSYNVGPAAHLSVPGFKGSPRYDGFYGELKAATTGGFIGMKAVPTDKDIADAKSKTLDVLKTALQSNFVTSYPPDFKVLDGASNFNLTKLTVNPDTDANGKFSVFAEGSISAIGFREADLKNVLIALESKDNPGDAFNQLNLNYSQVQPDFKAGTVSFSLSAQGVLTAAFSTDDFKAKILGQKVDAVRKMIAPLQGLSDARVSLWPVWLSTLPKDPKRVTLVVN